MNNIKKYFRFKIFALLILNECTLYISYSESSKLQKLNLKFCVFLSLKKTFLSWSKYSIMCCNSSKPKMAVCQVKALYKNSPALPIFKHSWLSICLPVLFSFAEILPKLKNCFCSILFENIFTFISWTKCAY